MSEYVYFARRIVFNMCFIKQPEHSEAFQKRIINNSVQFKTYFIFILVFSIKNNLVKTIEKIKKVENADI